ncbi:MAG: hypothetical protein B0W54_17320 [Cellvibrio sp. 79]|nr:MAG: hypothetical protein B0W54_17320 [Cellvibrio sp. 79]
MPKHYWFFLLFAFTSIDLQAGSLQLDEQYTVFDRQPINLKKVIGHKPVYIKFWATWCLECRKELPSLQQAYEKHHNQIAMYAVNLNINETDEYIRRLQQQHKLTIPIVMDNNGSIASNFQFLGTPFHALINAKGDVVYTTYKDDIELQQQLQKLANNTAIKNTNTSYPTTEKIKPLPKGISLLYFSATWCDWYMKDIHPEMTANCLAATKLVNDIYQKQPGIPLQAYVTHLWTEQKDLDQYLQKFSIHYPVSIDTDNRITQHYNNSDYPALLLFNDGHEIKRFKKFDDITGVNESINKILSTNKKPQP